MGQIEDVRAFVRIVEMESIGKAAEHYGTAKSAMSRKLKMLEERLQTELITRTTRQWALTDAGRQYYARAVDILSALDEADAEMRSEKRTLRGEIRLSVPVHYGNCVLAPHLLDFIDANRGVHLISDFTDRFVDLVGEHYDLAIRISRPADSSMIARKLGTSQHMFCASPDYLAEHSAISQPTDLKSHRILSIGHSARFKWSFGARNGKTAGVSLGAAHNTNNGEFLVDAAARGMGIVRLPDFLAKPAIGAGKLAEILPDHRPPPLEVHIVYPASRHLPARVRGLIDHLVDRVNRADPPPKRGAVGPMRKTG